MNEYDKYLINIDKIFNHYGLESQLNKLVEEIGKLLIAIRCKCAFGPIQAPFQRHLFSRNPISKSATPG